MNIKCVERQISYTLEDGENGIHEYSISTNKQDEEQKATTHIVTGESEMVIPTSEIPFLIEVLQLFASDYGKINE
ncbi:hypothetical protein [Bacteroides sp.]|uniref:hypothetical protein n=1 Tax=Bacteroides sp. TaxID=29523 RepID=UPI002604EF39|nr:hypothetical protein [Bacteroides sp.]MDD3040905.1 hypothetical protein [Bacteroides sp.]